MSEWMLLGGKNPWDWGAYGEGADRVGEEELFSPVQDQAAGGMPPAGLDGSDAVQYPLAVTGGALDQARSRLWGLLAAPWPVGGREEYGCRVEGFGPGRVGGVALWVGDDDGLQAA